MWKREKARAKKKYTSIASSYQCVRKDKSVFGSKREKSEGDEKRHEVALSLSLREE